MRLAFRLVLVAIILFGSVVGVLGSNVRTDYDHSVNFSQYHTYSWGQVKTSDPFYVQRLKDAVDQQLQAKGWQLMPSGGAVTILATDNVHNQKEVQTMYDGWGGGWGGGWGWGGWGWGGWAGPGGFGTATTTTRNQPVSNVVVDLFDSGSKNLLWRGLATLDLGNNANKNTNSLDNDIKADVQELPSEAGPLRASDFFNR